MTNADIITVTPYLDWHMLLLFDVLNVVFFKCSVNTLTIYNDTIRCPIMK